MLLLPLILRLKPKKGDAKGPVQNPPLSPGGGCNGYSPSPTLSPKPSSSDTLFTFVSSFRNFPTLVLLTAYGTKHVGSQGYSKTCPKSNRLNLPNSFLRLTGLLCKHHHPESKKRKTNKQKNNNKVSLL